MKLFRLIALLATLTIVAAACGSDTAASVEAAAEAAAAEADEAMADDAMEDEDAMADDAMEEEDHSEDAMDDEAMEEDAAMEDEEAMADDAMRIVSLSPTATEMLFAVGAGDLVVAVDAFSNFPAEAPVTELSGWEPNLEAIAGYEPTHVFSSGPIEGLDALSIENVVLPAAATFDDVYSQIEQVGAATGHVGDAAEVVANMQSDIQAVLDALPERETALTYYHELDNTLYSVTSGTFIGEVYMMLGLENAIDAADPDNAAFGYPQVTEEYLVTANPDIIFLADTICCEQSAETVAARPGWDQLSAVQNGNIVELNDDIASRWSPRLVEFIQTAGEAIAAIEAVPAS